MLGCHHWYCKQEPSSCSVTSSGDIVFPLCCVVTLGKPCCAMIFQNFQFGDFLASFVVLSSLSLFKKNIYLLGCTRSWLRHIGSFSCGTQSLQSWLVSSAAACKLLVAARGIQFLTRDQTQASCFGNVKSQPLHHQGSPTMSSLYSLPHQGDQVFYPS